MTETILCEEKLPITREFCRIIIIMRSLEHIMRGLVFSLDQRQTNQGELFV